MEAVMILVVDDDPTNRLVLTRMLQTRGHRVAEVDNGADAIAVTETLSPELVLMDINMPGMTGIEAARRIIDRLGPVTPPLVAVTADTSSAQRAACEAAGFVAFIDKPVTMRALFSALAAAGDEGGGGGRDGGNKTRHGPAVKDGGTGHQADCGPGEEGAG